MNKFKFVIFVIILSFVFFKILMALPKDQIASSKTIKIPAPIMKQIKEVKILEKSNSTISTQETLVFNSILTKEITQTTRKFAVPLLEYLDKEKITYRVGNERKFCK